MTVYLPVAGVRLDVLLLVATGGLTGFLSGLLGIGGGWLLTPILIMIGVPPTVAVASSNNAIVATSASGISVHFRHGHVDTRLGLLLLVGGLAGGAIGVRIIRHLLLTGRADGTIELMYVVMLSGVGLYTLADSLRSLRGSMSAVEVRRDRRSVVARWPFQVRFPCWGVQHSMLVLLTAGALVGLLAALMGVGGGFIMLPLMIYLLRVPVHAAIGTSLFQVLFTCAGLTYLHAVTIHTVDLTLAMIVAAGSVLGAQVGARVAPRLRGEHLKWVLAILALVVAVKMAFGLSLSRPADRPAAIVSSTSGERGLLGVVKK